MAVSFPTAARAAMQATLPTVCGAVNDRTSAVLSRASGGARGARERRSSVRRAARGAARWCLLLRGGGERALEREGRRGQRADAARAARRRAPDLLSHP